MGLLVKLNSFSQEIKMKKVKVKIICSYVSCVSAPQVDATCEHIV